jgi:DNA-binding CsgD family transcriptional regulator
MTTTTTAPRALERSQARIALRIAAERLEQARQLERSAIVERAGAVERARAAGLTTAEIAAVLGISRQAVLLIG